MGIAVTETPPTRDAVESAPRGRFSLAVVVAAVVTGLLVGYAVAMLAPPPRLTGPGTPGGESAEAGFARDMIAHHSQAVAMGVIAYRSATTEEVAVLALDIATGQQGEIGMMNQWLRDWHLSPNSSRPPMAWVPDGAQMVRGNLMPGMATSGEMARLREAEGVEVDRLFLELMTLHHLGGIHMVDAMLELTDHPEVTHLAERMRTVQRSDLQAMQSLQEGLG